MFTGAPGINCIFIHIHEYNVLHVLGKKTSKVVNKKTCFAYVIELPRTINEVDVFMVKNNSDNGKRYDNTARNGMNNLGKSVNNKLLNNIFCTMKLRFYKDKRRRTNI